MLYKRIFTLLLVFFLIGGIFPISADADFDLSGGFAYVDEDASKDLLLYGAASKQADGSVELTPLSTYSSGSAWYQRQVITISGFTARFDFWAGGGRDDSYGGADGIVLTFAAETGLGSDGEHMGFVPGSYGVELDSYPWNPGDPAGKHAAIIYDRVSNHLVSTLEERVDDSQWHTLEVIYDPGTILVKLDGSTLLFQDEIWLPDEIYIGISAATGGGYNRHLIREFYIMGFISRGNYFDRREEHPIIVIPGVMGSKLYSDKECTELVWPPSAGSVIWDAVNPFSSISRKMSQGITLYVANNYLDQAKLQESQREYGSLDTYKVLVNHLCEKYGNERKIYVFSYDFRQSNMDSARDLKKFIDWVDANAVDIICHSMGGLVLSCYVSLYGTDRLGKTVTMGTPYEGAPKLLNSVLNWDVLTNSYEAKGLKGIKDTASDELLGMAGLTKAVKAGFPAIAQLAPSEAFFPCYPFYLHEYTLDRNLFGELRVYRPIDYSTYKAICSQIFSPANFRDAENMFAAIKTSDGLNILTTYGQSYFVIGIGQPTIVSLAFSGGGSLDSIEADKLFVECTDLSYDFSGDGTVPYLSSTMLAKLNSIPDSAGRVLKVEATHGDIVSKDKALSFLDKVLQGEDSASVPDDRGHTGKYVVVKVACPVDVTVSGRDGILSSAGDTLSVFSSFGRMDILGSNDEIKIFCLDAEQVHDIRINGTGEGTLDYSIRYFSADGTLEAQRTCTDVPITEHTVITTNTDADNPCLTVDPNGDGQNSYVLMESSEPYEVYLKNAVTFTDIDQKAYYYDAVLWAVEKGITNGTSATAFSPDNTVTRGQAVTFLWRTMGKPEPASAANPFSDVHEGDYYEKAVLWAVEKGITKGTSATEFSPWQTCSTAHIITFLYRALGIGSDGWYAEAGEWAKTGGLLDGTGASVSPGENCPRRNVVTFLYRLFGWD